MVKVLRKSAVMLLQVALTACFFYVLNGGAALIDWTQVPRWKKVLMFTTYAAAFLCAGTAVFLYFKDRGKLAELQPFRMIRAFFDLSPWLSVGALYVAFLATQFAQQIAMHHALETHFFDFGIFDQVLWNTAYGDFLISSARGGIHIFAEHFKPILVWIAALYRLKSEVWFLLFATDLMTASSLVAVYLIAREVTRSHASSLAVAVCVFFYPSLVSGINFLYHTQMLIDPFLLWGFYLILKRRALPAFLLFLLALASKESAVPDLLGLGFFLMATRKKTAGSVATAMSLLWLLFFMLWIEPRFDFSTHFRSKWAFFSGWVNPSWETLHALWSPPNPVVFFFRVFGPFLFLSLACPKWWLLLGPSLLFRLLSDIPGFRSTTCHYMGGAEALVFISAIYGFAAWVGPAALGTAKNFFSRLVSVLKDPGLVRIVLVLAAVLLAGCPQLVVINRFLGEAAKPENQRVVRVLDSISSGYSVEATHNLAGHVSHRSHLYVFCEAFPKTPYEELAKRPDLVVFDKRQGAECSVATLRDLVSRGYTRIFGTDYLDIYSNPADRWVDANALRQKWRLLADRPPVPYRAVVYFWYRMILGFAGTLFVILIAYRTWRDS